MTKTGRMASVVIAADPCRKVTEAEAETVSEGSGDGGLRDIDGLGILKIPTGFARPSNPDEESGADEECSKETKRFRRRRGRTAGVRFVKTRERGIWMRKCKAPDGAEDSDCVQRLRCNGNDDTVLEGNILPGCVQPVKCVVADLDAPPDDENGGCDVIRECRPQGAAVTEADVTNAVTNHLEAAKADAIKRMRNEYDAAKLRCANDKGACAELKEKRESLAKQYEEALATLRTKKEALTQEVSAAATASEREEKEAELDELTDAYDTLVAASTSLEESTSDTTTAPDESGAAGSAAAAVLTLLAVAVAVVVV